MQRPPERLIPVSYTHLDVYKRQAHDCTYYARVTIAQKATKDRNFAEGSGRSKKEAEQQAAKALLAKLGIV